MRRPKRRARRRPTARRLLTPIAKAYSSEIGDLVASKGVQIFGGMGYIEETGAAQFMRDARIAAIYEGANGIQAIDLVQRKIALEGGDTVRREIAGIREIVADIVARGGEAFGATARRLSEAADALDTATKYLLDALARDPADALAGATPYLRLFGLALGGACLAKAGLAEQAQANGARADRAGRARAVFRGETRNRRAGARRDRAFRRRRAQIL